MIDDIDKIARELAHELRTLANANRLAAYASAGDHSRREDMFSFCITSVTADKVSDIINQLLYERRETIPNGWQLVPKEPTEQMVHAAIMTHVRENKGIEHSPFLSYKAMLAATTPDAQQSPLKNNP
jgi:signal transduction histidine kinase